MPKASRFIGDKAKDGGGDNGKDGQPINGVETAAKVNKVIRETNGNSRTNKQAQQMDLNGRWLAIIF